MIYIKIFQRFKGLMITGLTGKQVLTGKQISDIFGIVSTLENPKPPQGL